MRQGSTHLAEVEHRYSGENPIRTLLYLFEEQKFSVAVAFVLFSIKHSPSWVIPLLTANIIDIITSHKSATELLLQKNPVDGIVASNDLIAIGVAHAVASLGSQCKVVSFDDFAISKLMNVPTLDHDPRRLGVLAGESLMRRIKNPNEKNFGEVLMKLNFREEPIKAVTSNG